MKMIAVKILMDDFGNYFAIPNEFEQQFIVDLRSQLNDINNKGLRKNTIAANRESVMGKYSKYLVDSINHKQLFIEDADTN